MKVGGRGVIRSALMLEMATSPFLGSKKRELTINVERICYEGCHGISLKKHDRVDFLVVSVALIISPSRDSGVQGQNKKKYWRGVDLYVWEVKWIFW